MAFRSVWEPQQEAMKMVLPLLMQKKQFEEELAVKKQKLDQEAATLQAEKAEKEAELVRKAQEGQLKLLVDTAAKQHEKAFDSGDLGAVEATGRTMQSLGLPVFGQEQAGPTLPGMDRPMSWYAKEKENAPIMGSEGWKAAKRFEAGLKDDDAKQADITKFELVAYGRLRPDLRGTPEYKKGFLQLQRDMKEQSPYVDALNRQVDVTAKREGSALRKEFYDSPEVKTYQEVSRQADVMAEALKESKTGKNMVAVDQALITVMNKMMDPSSVVRESEYARTPGDLALMNRVKGAVEKIRKGGAGLTQEDREAISTMGKKYMVATEKRYKSKLHEYKGYLSNYGLDPDKYLKPDADREKAQDFSAMSDEDILKALEK